MRMRCSVVCEPFATALASCDRCDPQTIRGDCGSQKESRPTDKFERRESVVQSKDECVGDKVHTVGRTTSFVSYFGYYDF
jgi:hypothetical protein